MVSKTMKELDEYYLTVIISHNMDSNFQVRDIRVHIYAIGLFYPMMYVSTR